MHPNEFVLHANINPTVYNCSRYTYSRCYRQHGRQASAAALLANSSTHLPAAFIHSSRHRTQHTAGDKVHSKAFAFAAAASSGCLHSSLPNC